MAQTRSTRPAEDDAADQRIWTRWQSLPQSAKDAVDKVVPFHFFMGGGRLGEALFQTALEKAQVTV